MIVMENNIRLTVFGARGSIPIEGEKFSIYGGATSCYRITAGDEEIYLDAGSGLVGATPSSDARITILLTHMHFDHIIGLPFFSALGCVDRSIDIYARQRSGLMLRDALERLIAPPFWPLKIGEYPASVKFHELAASEKFSIGEVDVETIEGRHPGGSTIYRLTYHGKSIVYATDFEHSTESIAALAKFARGCDLLMYDAQYRADEYDRYKGYGHSTPESGLTVAAEACASKILFIHHSPRRSDEELSAMEREISARSENVMFAKLGDEIVL